MRCMCGAADCIPCRGATAEVLVPCIGQASGDCGREGPPDPDALFPIYECPECAESRADADACGERRDDG